MARQTRDSLFEGPTVVRPDSPDTIPLSPAVQKDKLWLLWENREFLWRWTLRGLLLSTLIACLLPNRYRAVTRVMPPDNNSNSGMAMLAALAGGGRGGGGDSMSGASGGMSNLGMIAGDMLGLKSTDAMWIGILRSDTVQDRVIDRFNLRKVYWDKYMQDARKDLDGFTDITEDRKSGILTIKVTDRNRDRSAAMARAYIDELNKLVSQLSTSAARREREFIEGRLHTVKQELDDASHEFSQYASKNTAVDITAQERAMVESAGRLQGELIAAQSELEGLQQIYTGNNIRVKTLRARIGELKRQLGILGGQEDSSPQQAGQEQLYPSIRKLPLLAVRWVDLYRQAKIEETVYELLRQRYEMARIEEAKEVASVKVLDEAAVPEKKDSPHRLVIILVCSLLTFAGAAVWVLGENLWRGVDSQHPKKLLLGAVYEHARDRFSARVGPLYSRFRQNSHGKDHDTLSQD